MSSKAAKRLLISTDHKWRDLPGNVYLSLMLKKFFDVDAKVIPVWTEGEWTKNFRPHAITVTSLVPGLVRRAEMCRDTGIKVIFMPTEGRPNMELTTDFMDYIFGIKNNEYYADLTLVWGREMMRKYQKHNVLSKVPSRLTGVGRFDLYRHPLSKTLASKEAFLKKYGMPPDARLVTVASSYVYSSGYDDDAEKMKESLAFKTIVSSLTELQHYNRDSVALQRIVKDHSGRIGISKLIPRLASEFTDVVIGVKPHPSEDFMYYQQLIEELGLKNRLFLILSEYIWDVLNATDLHIADSCCTTLTEAWFLGKPTIGMEFGKEEYINQDHINGNDLASSVEGVLDLTRKKLADGKEEIDRYRDYRTGYIDKYYYRVDGLRTYETARAIAEFLDQQTEQPDWDFKPGLSMKQKAYKFVMDLIPRRRAKKEDKPSTPETSVDPYGRWDKNVTLKDVESWEMKLAPIVSSLSFKDNKGAG